MRYTKLGNTGLIVSRAAFGAMTFSSGNRDLPAIFKIEASIADKLVGQALDAGVNFFDTADVYARGQSEEMLGRALGAKRKDAVISTKVGGRMSGGGLLDAGLSRRHIMSSIDDSLRRLGTDYIDVYIVHRDDPNTPMEETLTALDAVVRAGKARYIGFSNWSAWRVAAAMEIMKTNGLAPFSHGQMYYSLVARELEQDVLPMMAQYGLGLTVWSPLSGGFLTGKYRRDAENADMRYSDPNSMMPMDLDHGYAVVAAMRPIADRLGVSMAQLALAWLFAKPAVTSILLGASKPEQLADTLAAEAIVLAPEIMAELDAASATRKLYPHWFLDRFGDRKLEAALAGKLRRPAETTSR